MSRSVWVSVCVGMCQSELHWGRVFLTLYRVMSAAQVTKVCSAWECLNEINIVENNHFLVTNIIVCIFLFYFFLTPPIFSHLSLPVSCLTQCWCSQVWPLCVCVCTHICQRNELCVHKTEKLAYQLSHSFEELWRKVIWNRCFILMRFLLPEAESVIRKAY